MPIDDVTIADADHVLRWCHSTRVFLDENQNKLRAYDDDRALWGFFFEEANNLGLSVDHRERILTDNPGVTVIEAVRRYISTAFGGTYFQKRCWLKLRIAILRGNGLGITNTPETERDRPHHCDIWPSDGHTDYITGQYEAISQAYEVEIDNRA